MSAAIDMPEHKCEACNKTFGSAEALGQHNSSKHAPKETKRGGGKPTGKYAAAIVIIMVVVGAYLVFKGPSDFSPSRNIKGNPNATITIVEFSDFECPVCRVAESGLKQIMEQFGSKVRLVYKHFPLTGIHPYAFGAAEASECAAGQGKFWEYHDKLFENQNYLATSDLKSYAELLGMDAEKFNRCLDSGSMSSRVDADFQEGLSRSIGGTPTFFINGQKWEGVLTVDKFRQLAGI